MIVLLPILPFIFFFCLLSWLPQFSPAAVADDIVGGNANDDVNKDDDDDKDSFDTVALSGSTWDMLSILLFDSPVMVTMMMVITIFVYERPDNPFSNHQIVFQSILRVILSMVGWHVVLSSIKRPDLIVSNYLMMPLVMMVMMILLTIKIFIVLPDLSYLKHDLLDLLQLLLLLMMIMMALMMMIMLNM